ncbi:MAG: DnaJ-like cysteine-rich domain-containing protein [Planctomycetota bacterium]|jgi:hypothetical protein
MAYGRAGVLAVVAAAMFVLVTQASAEIIRLPDGRFLQGEIVESDKAGFRFKRWDTGGEIRLSWDQVHEEDRLRLRKALGLEFSEEGQRVTVEGFCFHLRGGDIVEGIVLEETAEYLRIRRSTGEFKYPKEIIKHKEPIGLDILSIYSEEEAYANHLKKNKEPETADEHYDLATWCRQIGYFEKEKEHLLAVQSEKPDFKPDFIQNRLDALDALVEQAQVRRRIKEIMRLAARKKFGEAEAAWTELQGEFPDSDIVQEDTEKVAESIQQAKTRYTRSVVIKDWYGNMRRILRKWSLDKDLKLADAKKNLQKDLTTEIVNLISERRKLEGDDIKTAFEERKVYNVYKGNYGTGTFIVEKGSRSRAGGGGIIDDLGRKLGLDKATRDKLRGMSGSEKSSKKKKVMSPDDWWEIATADMKYQWMLAFYAENGGQMEVVRVEMKDCPNCRGRGYVTFLSAGGGPTGEESGTQKRMCPRCQSLGKDKIVVFK